MMAPGTNNVMPEATCEEDLAGRLKAVLRSLPAPVGIVTCHDPAQGKPMGLAMSAIMPVSLAPCSMAVAVNRSGASHEAIMRAGEYCINLLNPQTGDHMAPFANPDRRTERFTGTHWQQAGNGWYIAGAPASIFCKIRHTISHGTHDVLIGDVTRIITPFADSTGCGLILGWANGALGTLAPLAD